MMLYSSPVYGSQHQLHLLCSCYAELLSGTSECPFLVSLFWTSRALTHIAMLCAVELVLDQ